MKSILDESCVMKWKNTDTYKVLKQKIISNVVLVTEEIIDKYGAREISPFYISKSLFTNQELVDILNLFNLRSIKGGSYIIINEYNKSLPIKWNEIKQQYVVSNEYKEHPVTGISWEGACFIAKLFDYKIVRLEDIVNDPQEETSKMMSFLNKGLSDEQVAFLSKVYVEDKKGKAFSVFTSKDRVLNDWKGRVSIEDEKYIRRILCNEMEEYRYI